MNKMGEAILFLIALVLSISVHEFGHAWAATKLGDTLPKSQGRLTLSPVAHTDPIGTLLFPLIMIFSGVPLLGWGRPVLTNPLNYTRRFSRATGSMLVALAGPAMNFLLATLVSLIVALGVRSGLLDPRFLDVLLRHLVALNVSLLIFNLLPIPPLDGGAVLAWFLPRSMQHVVDFLERWGFIILIGLMMTRVLDVIMRPGYVVANAWVNFILRMLLT